MNKQKEKLKEAARELLSLNWYTSATAEDLADYLYSNGCYIIKTADDMAELLPRPKFFIVENDVQKYPGWDKYMMLELTPDITWEGTNWGIQYDFPAAYKRTVFESLPYYDNVQREVRKKEAEAFFKDLDGVVEE